MAMETLKRFTEHFWGLWRYTALQSLAELQGASSIEPHGTSRSFVESWGASGSFNSDQTYGVALSRLQGAGWNGA